MRSPGSGARSARGRGGERSRRAVRHAAGLEGRHLAEDLHRGPGEADTERRSRAFAQAHAEVEVWIETERLENVSRAGLGGAMGGEKAVTRLRLDAHRGEGRRPRDEAIDHHGNARGGAGQNDATESRDLESAHLGEHVDTVRT